MIKNKDDDFIEAFANKNSYTIVSANFIKNIDQNKVAIIKVKYHETAQYDYLHIFKQKGIVLFEIISY